LSERDVGRIGKASVIYGRTPPNGHDGNEKPGHLIKKECPHESPSLQRLEIEGSKYQEPQQGATPLHHAANKGVAIQLRRDAALVGKRALMSQKRSTVPIMIAVMSMTETVLKSRVVPREANKSPFCINAAPTFPFLARIMPISG